MSASEVPLRLPHKLQDSDLVQMDDIMGLVGELVCGLIGDQYTFDWIEIDEAKILGKLSYVHFR